MEVYDHAFGPCAVCGRLCEEVSQYYCHQAKKLMPGSLYWTPLPPHVWNTVRPFVAPLFQDEDHIQNVLFIPEYSKPFCSAACSLAYHNGCGG